MHSVVSSQSGSHTFPKEVWLRFIEQVVFELDKKVRLNQEENSMEKHIDRVNSMYKKPRLNVPCRAKCII